jgi:hypothetical protein
MASRIPGILLFQSGQCGGAGAPPQPLPKHQRQVNPVNYSMRDCDGYTSVVAVIACIRGGQSLYANCCKGDGTTSVCNRARTTIRTIRDRHTASGRSASRSYYCNAVMNGDRFTESGWIGQVRCDGRGGIGRIGWIDQMIRCRGGGAGAEIRITRIHGCKGLCAR